MAARQQNGLNHYQKDKAMSKVFITQQAPGLDFSQAEDFGRVVTIWPHNAQVWGDSTHLAEIAREKLSTVEERLATAETLWLTAGE